MSTEKEYNKKQTAGKDRKKQKRHKKIFISLSLKMIAIISAILGVTLLTVTTISLYYFQNDSELRVRENTFNMSRAIARNIEIKFSVLREQALIIAEDMAAGRDSSMSSAGRRIFSTSEELLAVALAEKKKNTLEARISINPGIQELQTFSKANILKAVKEEAPMFEQTFAGREDIHNSSPLFQEMVSCISFPFPSKGKQDSSSQKIIIAYIAINEFKDIFTVSDLTTTYFINSSNDIILHPDRSLIDVNTNLSSYVFIQRMNKINQNNGQIIYTELDGREYISSFQKISFAGISVITTADKDKAFQMIYKLQRQDRYMAAIILCLAILIVYLFSNAMIRPIQILASATKKIEKGDFNIRLRPAANDEVGQLTKAFVSMGRGLAERERIKNVFGKFMNKNIVNMLTKKEIKLGGERKTAVIFFSDIRSFTSISERMEPEQIVDFLNEYMTRMVACVDKTGGIVDKFIGDAIMAIWGTPVAGEHDTENAINAALLMRKALIEFNKGRGTKEKPIIRIGCGINTGSILAGQIGSMDRMEYTVIGDAVNLASRIESLNKTFGTDILISEASMKLAGDKFKVKAMKKIRVKGKKDYQQVYAVLGRKDDPDCPEDLLTIRKMTGMDDATIRKYLSMDMNGDEFIESEN